MPETTKEAIIKAAKDIFVSKGYAATRMQEIADAANINKAMLHYYYKSKETLFQEITTQTLELVFPRFAQALEHEGTVMEKIENVVNIYIETIRHHPYVPLFIITELSQKRADFLVEIQKRMEGFPKLHLFLAQMEEEMKAGTIRKMPPMHLFLNVMSLCVFPFIAQPVYCTVVGISEQRYDAMMQERAGIVNDFIRSALQP